MRFGRTCDRAVGAAAVLLFVASLALLGWLAAHALTFALAGVLAGDGHLHTGPHLHHYLEHLDAWALVGLITGAAGVAATARRGAAARWLQGSGGGRTHLLAGGVPVAAFLLIEYAEGPAVAGGGAVASLLIGAVLQVALGLIALRLSRTALRAVARLVLSPRPTRVVAPIEHTACTCADRKPSAGFDWQRPGRAPPQRRIAVL